MTMYDDLPKQIRDFFGANRMPLEMRQVITHGWDEMDSDEQQKLIKTLKIYKKDPKKCILIAWTAVGVSLMEKSEAEEIGL